MYGGNYTQCFVFANWGEGVFFGGGVRFSALAGVDRSGRGFNPRPALLPTGTPQLALPDRHSTSGIRYFRIWNCRQTFGRGGAFRPCAGRGLYPRPERSTPAKYLPCFQIRKGIRAINLSNCFLSSVALLSRGWIVPVGDAIPDRRRGGRPLPCSCGGGSFRSGIQSPTGAEGGGRFSALAGVDRSGRGCNPRPARKTEDRGQRAEDRGGTHGVRFGKGGWERQGFGGTGGIWKKGWGWDIIAPELFPESTQRNSR